VSNATISDATLGYVNWLRTLYLHARNEKRNRREAWLRNYRLLNNRVGAPQSSQWQPSPRSSEIYPIISNWVAWATDNDIVIDINPAADPHSDFFQFNGKVANDLSAVLYATWQSENFSGQTKLDLWDAATYGTGIFKSVWDNSVCDGYGNALLKRVDPYTIYPDPHASNVNDCSYIVEARMMSLSEIERRWPDHVLEVEAQGAGEDTQLDSRPKAAAGSGSHIPVNPGGQTGSYRWGIGQDRSEEGSAMQRYPVYEFWIRDSRPWWDEDDDGAKHVEDSWKVVVTCRNVILMEEQAEDIMPFNGHPYDDFRFDDIGEFWGISLVEHMAQPQLYINRLLTALQMNAEMCGNPIFVEPANSGIARTTIPARPGNRLTVNANAMASGGRPDWLQPPSMPPQVLDLVNFWISRMENLSGMSAMTKGQSPPTQRSAQGTINTIQEAAFVRVRAAQRNLERTLESCARKLADLIIANYTEPRIMSVAGPGAQKSAIALSARHFLVPTPKGAEPLKYSLLIQAGASAPTSRQARVGEADKLFAMGAIDDQALLEAHQYPNLNEIIQRRIAKQSAGVHQPPGARQRSQRQTG
jgi:hypothetical protein